MLRQVQDDGVVSDQAIGRRQHRRSSGQHHQVIGYGGGDAAGADGPLAGAMEFPALVIQHIEHHRRLGDEHAAGLPQLGRGEQGELIAGPIHLGMLDAHAAPKQSLLRRQQILLRENLRQRIGCPLRSTRLA